ncbi:MAG: phosphatase PAP2 family protein [Candidatus Micrarchaeota archaeon]
MLEALSQAFFFAAAALDNSFVFIALVLAALFLTEKKPEKRNKVLLALAAAYLLVFAAKNIVMQPRPCWSASALIECPPDYSMPSGHAAIAFTLMIAFLGTPYFPLYWVFAVLVAYTRIYLGVHTFGDVAAGLVVAPVAYHITDLFWGAFVERNR